MNKIVDGMDDEGNTGEAYSCSGPFLRTGTEEASTSEKDGSDGADSVDRESWDRNGSCNKDEFKNWTSMRKEYFLYLKFAR
jgi:hypothetical protein